MYTITTHVDCNTKEFHYDMVMAQSVLSDNLSIITVIYLTYRQIIDFSTPVSSSLYMSAVGSSSAFLSFSNVNLYL